MFSKYLFYINIICAKEASMTSCVNDILFILKIITLLLETDNNKTLSFNVEAKDRVRK